MIDMNGDFNFFYWITKRGNIKTIVNIVNGIKRLLKLNNRML